VRETPTGREMRDKHRPAVQQSEAGMGAYVTHPDAGGGVCVSTVSIVCGRDGGLRERARHRPVEIVLALIVNEHGPTNLLNAIQEDRARRFKQHLLVVAKEPPYGEAAAARQPGTARRRAKWASWRDYRMRASRYWLQSSARVPRARVSARARH
jgi:hypothetical protein